MHMETWQAPGGDGAGRTATVPIVAFVAILLAVGCGSNRTPSPEDADPPVVVAAGDIATCSRTGDEATASLIGGIDGTVLALGDSAYPDGSAEDFEECYDPTWGRFKDRTKPAPGNHEYHTPGAQGYFDYFGKAAGDPDKGYYSYDLGAWHLIALNSNNCEGALGGCGVSSPQVRWLKADLAKNEKKCTLAYFHHPRYSSGEEHGNNPEVKPFWEVLYEAGADVVLSGHEHNYERFAPQDSYWKADPERGIREFVVGTGGNSHYEILDALPNSEIHNDDTYGVLKLTLHPKSYEWRFLPVAGGEFTDSGDDQCH